MPKSLTLATEPCLRTPIPDAPLLPALVFPLMFRQIPSSPLAALPASTRIPYLAVPPALIGVATLFAAIFRLKKPLVPRPTRRMPLPSV